ncbi:MAG: FKBP-type peptidyl-prolyl cis-trans isomerase [Lachnospiraceae bacterium]|nr:FKBP-type peptidyl-prolyl cis-trans isomerase [Lachnospiraceae bacterium]
MGNDTVTILDYDMTQYVKVGDYRNLDVVYSETEITDDIVDYAYLNFLSDYAEAVDPSYYETEREVRDGDIISLDFCGKKDGVAFEGGTATGYILEIGSGTFIPGFEEGLIGVMPGEEVDLDLTFPESYQSAELAGQAVVFTCTVQGIVTIDSILATANDNLEPGQNPIKTEEDLRDLCRTELLKQSADYAMQDLESQILNALPALVTELQEMPADLKTSYDDLTLQSITNMAATYYGMDPETLLSYNGMTVDDYIAMYSYPQLLSDAALYCIAAENGMLPTEEEYAQLMSDYIAESGMSQDLVFAELSEEQYRVYFLEEKVMDYLKELYVTK